MSQVCLYVNAGSLDPLRGNSAVELTEVATALTTMDNDIYTMI